MIRRLLRARRPTGHTFAPGHREEDYPPPFPSGWYRVADSDDLRPGEVMALDVLGHHLVAFRGEGGRAAVLDAHCPHQGASLAGGHVCGDSMICPFHRWQFGSDGALERIPGLDRAPSVGVRSWPVRERYGMIWLYHHVSGEVVEPPYEVETHADVDAGELVARGSYDAGTVRMHLSEFAENSVDFQHFDVLHGQLRVPWTTLPIPGLTVDHRPDWQVDEDRPHIACFRDAACLRFRGKRLEWTAADAEITFFGPGGVVWFRFDVPGKGRILLFQTHTPLEPLRQHVRFRWYAERTMSRLLVHWVVGNWISQWWADVDVWENKVFRPRPVLVPVDGPVHRMRRWLAQFHRDGGPAPERRTHPARSVP